VIKQRLLALGFLLAVAGCTGPQASGSAPPPTGSPSAAPTSAPTALAASIAVWQFGNPGTQRQDGVTWEDWWADRIAEFNELYPDVEVDIQLKGQEAGGTTLFIDTALAAGEPPDVYLDVAFRQSKFEGQGLLEAVGSALSDEEWAAIAPSAAQVVTRSDGERWGIPVFIAPPFVVAINRSLAEAAGAADLIPADPDRDWTTDQFLTFLRAVTKAPDRYGVGLFAKTPSSTETLNGFAGGFGAKFYDGGDYCHNLIASEDGKRWMAWMDALVDEGLTLPGPAGLADADLSAAWVNQQIAVFAGGTFPIDVVKQAVDKGESDGFDITLVNYPHEADKPAPAVSANSPWAAIIFTQDDTARTAAAHEFLKFIGEQALLTDFAAGFGTLPVFVEDQAPWTKDDTNREFLLETFQERGAQDMGYAAARFTDLRLAWAETRQEIWSSDADIGEALDLFVAEADDILC
jgi:hypothetical protein